MWGLLAPTPPCVGLAHCIAPLGAGVLYGCVRGSCWSLWQCQRGLSMYKQLNTLRTHPYRPVCTQVAVGTGDSCPRSTPPAPKNISRASGALHNYPGRRQATHTPARLIGGDIAQPGGFCKREARGVDLRPRPERRAQQGALRQSEINAPPWSVLTRAGTPVHRKS